MALSEPFCNEKTQEILLGFSMQRLITAAGTELPAAAGWPGPAWRSQPG
jgi:hypothetical protein